MKADDLAMTYVVVWGPDSPRRLPGQDLRVVKPGRAYRRQRVVPYVAAGARVLMLVTGTTAVLERELLTRLRSRPGFVPAFASRREAEGLLPAGRSSPGAGWTECFRYESLRDVSLVVLAARQAVGV